MRAAARRSRCGSVTGKPIKFAGVGEKLDGLEPFHPERMAARILGMGDIVSLVEEARKGIDQVEAQKLAEKFKKGKGFDLEDFKGQLQQMKKMGGLASLVDKLPAQIAQAAASSPQLADDRALRRIEGIINSMTAAERAKPEIIKASRKRRIAAGAGRAGAGGEPPAEPVRRDAEDDETDAERRTGEDDAGDERGLPRDAVAPKKPCQSEPNSRRIAPFSAPRTPIPWL